MTVKIFHPLLAMIASATNNELAKYVESFGSVESATENFANRLRFKAYGRKCSASNCLGLLFSRRSRPVSARRND